jgi:hypothetical protein
MPNYFKLSVTTTTTTTQLLDGKGVYYDPFLQTNTGITTTGSGTSGSGCCVCPSQTTFLTTLADKLKAMVESLQKQFEELRNKAITYGEGAILASVDSSAAVGVRIEFIIYIQRYGPPTDGIFDTELLDEIRREYNLPIL